MQCQAKAKSTGEQCNRRAVNGYRVCTVHGGKTPQGIASPHFKTGLYSRNLPAHDAEQYEVLFDLGKDLFRLDDETAVITVMFRNALERAATGESGEVWRRLANIHEQMDAIAKKGADRTLEDTMMHAKLFDEFGDICRRGVMAYAARNEAVKLAEQKRKFVSDERKHWNEKYQTMQMDQVLLIIRSFLIAMKNSVERHVDEEAAGKVIVDVQRAANLVLGD